MKKFSRIFAVVFALVLCMALAVPAFATNAATEGSGTLTVYKYLTFKSTATLPATSFSFTLAPDTNGTTGWTAPDVAGITEGLASTTFTANFSTSSSVSNGLPSDNGTATSGMQYATESFTIDFTGITFPNPGVYHYTLTENTVSAPFTGDSTVLKIAVYVIAENDGTLKIAAVTAGTGDTKVDGKLTNDYTTYDLTLIKTVSGNQASHTDHFDFKVTVTNPTTANTTYPTTYNVTTTCGHSTVSNPDTITAGQETVFHLCKNENIVIQGLPAGATYTIEETTTGYTTTYKVGAATESTSSDTATGTLNEDTTVTFNNYRNGDVPTGILLTIAPFAALMVIGIAGVLFVVLKKRSAQ